MDPISAGASVLAFVLLGLKSAKTIHELFSLVNDGPQSVRQASESVQQLQSALDALSKSRALREDQSEDFKEHIKACTADIQRFSDKLGKLSIGDAERASGKFWKKIKRLFNEKDLENMSVVVDRHTSALNMRLGNIQSNVVFRIDDHVTTMSQELSLQRDVYHTQTNILNDHNGNLNKIKETLVDLRNDHNHIRDTVTTIPSATAAQADLTHQMIRQLQEQVSNLTLNMQGHGQVVEIKDEIVVPAKQPSKKQAAYEELLKTILQLCDIIRDTKGMVGSDEADDLIEALERLFNFMRADEFFESVNEVARTDSNIDILSKRDFHRDLRRIQGAITSTGKLLLNDSGQFHMEKGTVLAQGSWKFKSYDLGSGSLSIMSAQRSWRQCRISGDLDDPTSTQTWPDRYEESTSDICFIPNIVNGRHRQMFKASMRTMEGPHGIFNSIPRLFVNNILPANSLVFSLVAEGRLNEFETLLREGEASLRDHDEYGASLLFYAMRQPHMCRYLLDHGADVNHTACPAGSWVRCSSSRSQPLGFDWSNFKSSTLLEAEEYDLLMGDEVQLLNMCRKMVLEAGCDPTIPANAESQIPNSLEDAFRYGGPESIRLYLDMAKCFVGVNMKLFDGRTPLLEHCWGENWTTESLTLFLQRGADIHAVDKLDRTCLQLCIDGLPEHDIKKDQRIVRQHRDALVFLVRKGVDIHHGADEGVSVSDVAYGRDPSWYDCGSYRGDLWDCVLAICGYQIPDFRGTRYPRKGSHNRNYTRRSFKEMWSGFERLCPYYNDPYGHEVETDPGGFKRVEELMATSSPGDSDGDSSDSDGGIRLDDSEDEDTD